MTEQNIMMGLPILGIILLLLIWKIFGTKQASSTIFMLSIYSLFLGSFSSHLVLGLKNKR